MKALYKLLGGKGWRKRAAEQRATPNILLVYGVITLCPSPQPPAPLLLVV